MKAQANAPDTRFAVHDLFSATQIETFSDAPSAIEYAQSSSRPAQVYGVWDGEDLLIAVAVDGGLFVSEVVAIERMDKALYALSAWQALAEQSMSFRLTLTSLADGIGVELLKRTHEALELAEADK